MITNFTTLQEIIASALSISVDQVSNDLQYGDLPEWDSLGHMSIMMELEDHFAVEITTETIAELVSVPAIMEYLNNHDTE